MPPVDIDLLDPVAVAQSSLTEADPDLSAEGPDVVASRISPDVHRTHR